jgi:Mg-chelatase subunit ChlI
MPVQQDMDIGVPISTVYNQWTQFEEWPKFMHRVVSASQEDESHVSFKAKIWGKTKEFKAEITEQRPEERIEWKVTEGISHTGVITFHELAPRLTRIEVNLDLEPGSLIEKAARGMRFVKRAVRADMARFKAYVLMEEEETGEWRGTIEDGDVKSESSSSGGGSSSSRSRGSSDGSDSDSDSSSSGGSRSRSSGRSRSRGSSNGSSSGSGSSSSSSRRRSGSRS